MLKFTKYQTEINKFRFVYIVVFFISTCLLISNAQVIELFGKKHLVEFVSEEDTADFRPFDHYFVGDGKK